MSSRIRCLTVLSALAASAAFASAEAQINFIDHRGKVIELESRPERLVTMIRDSPLVYRAVDETAEHMVGINQTSLKKFEAGSYGDFLPELLTLNTSVATDSFTPNVEAILELRPDVVLQWTFDPKLIEPLERVGLKVVGWDCCTEQHRRDYLTMSGYISGRIDRAQTILGLHDESNEALRTVLKDVPAEETVSLLEVDQLQDQIRVIANSSRDYTLSGVANLAADDSGEWWRTIDAEQFLAWNPEIIVIFVWEDALRPSAFYEHPLLAGVDAIKNKRVYQVPKFNVSPDAPEVFLTAAWMARIAHPEKFAGAKSFREITKESYRSIYGVDLTDAQLDAVLEIEANKDSAGYADISG